MLPAMWWLKFYYKNAIVTAKIEGHKDYQEIDLGIAKLHFEIGVRGRKWKWEEVKKCYCEQWIIIEAISAHSEGEKSWIGVRAN